MKYFLGIDGGGTKTRAMLCDELMNIVCSAEGKGINYRAIGISAARNNLKDLIAALMNRTDVQIYSTFVGCAALSCRGTEEETNALCKGVIPSARIVMDSDVYIALQAMEQNGPAALAICGTGSMAAARNDDGVIQYAGGWGYLLGDEGSGYAIALDGIRAALRGYEGSGPATELTCAVKKAFGILKMDGIVDIVYSERFSPEIIARFAPVVFSLAQQNDETARHIITQNARSFGDTVNSLLKHIPSNTPLGLWGGLFQHQPYYRRVFSAYIQDTFPDCCISLLRNPPEYGAVLAAKRFAE